jgi:hypothetical protein
MLQPEVQGERAAHRQPTYVRLVDAKVPEQFVTVSDGDVLECGGTFLVLRDFWRSPPRPYHK